MFACSSKSDAHDETPTPTPSDAKDAATEGAAADAAVDAPPDAAAFPQTLWIEPDQGMSVVYDFMKTATKTLDMTMYELDDPMVTTILTGLASAGVKVRVILDQNLEMKENTTAYDALEAGGVDVHWANPTYSATHQKTVTIDGTTSAVMTLNLDPYYYSTTRDFAVVTSDPKDVAAIETTFAADLTNSAVTPPTGDGLVWSPTNAESAIVAVIAGAKKTLITENEEMSDSEVIGALTAAASRGVKVEVAMTNSKDWTSDFTELAAAGVSVATYPSNASIYIHAKVIVADYGTSDAQAFVGSENYSETSLTKNRELGIITTQAAVLTGLNATLTKDFMGGTPFSPAQ